MSLLHIRAYLPLQTCNQSLVRVVGNSPHQLHATFDLWRTIQIIKSKPQLSAQN